MRVPMGRALLLAAAVLLAPTSGTQVLRGVAGPARCAAPRLSAPAYTGGLVELDESSFADALADFEGLAVVKFYAPWCRSCRGIAPTYQRLVNQVGDVHGPDDVRFYAVRPTRSTHPLPPALTLPPTILYPRLLHPLSRPTQVNFKDHKQLGLRERVFALPAIHFYTRSLGRINRFTVSPATVSKRMKQELDMYLGESGHLNFLKQLAPNAENPVSPLVRFSGLVGLLQALVNVDDYLDSADQKDGDYINAALDADGRRLDELESLFSWIDTNGDGVIDASELAAVAAAVGALAPGVEESELDAAATEAIAGEFYTTLLEHAAVSIQGRLDSEAEADEEGEEAEAAAPSAKDEARPTLDFRSFVKLMTSREVSTFRKPDSELRTAFEAIDANSDGSISRDELTNAMETVVQNLPDPTEQAAGMDWAKEVAVAFDALDRDKSGSLDYEEFVAVLSGAAYTYDDES